jgi:hypothetical protein
MRSSHVKPTRRALGTSGGRERGQRRAVVTLASPVRKRVALAGTAGTAAGGPAGITCWSELESGGG